jgi:tetrapyrrole methylase family protein / MazG family protein
MEKHPIWIICYQTDPAPAVKILNETKRIYSRGNQVSRWLNESGIREIVPVLLSPDPAPLKEFVDGLAVEYEHGESIAYTTRMNPLAADIVVKKLMLYHPEIPIQWLEGSPVTAGAEIAKGMTASVGLTVIDGQELAGAYHLTISASQAAMIYYPNEGADLDGIGKLLQAVYPNTHKVQLQFERADGQLLWNEKPISELAGITTPVAALFVPARSPDSSLENFEEIIAHLRAPNGCPWDRKQTHTSLRTYLLEETYEALDALDKEDLEGLKEELGDLILQIALHAQIGVESGEFNMADILEGINRKIVRRHPHVFGDTIVAGETGVLQNWEKLKKQEREDNGTDETKGLLDGIPASFPALAQAQSIQDRAARVGFDWKEIEPVMDKVMEEYREVQDAPDEQERAKELGDLLFAVVNLVRWYKVDAESVLRGTNLKFRKRFAYIEQKSRETGKPMQEMTLEEMDVFWNEAKKL